MAAGVTRALAFGLAAGAGRRAVDVAQCRVHGRFVPIASEGGVTFWTGNHRDATGEGDLAANPRLKEQNVAFRAAHAGLSEEALEPLYYRDAWRFIAEDPAAWIGLLGRKLFYTVAPIGPSYQLHSPRYRLASRSPTRCCCRSRCWGRRRLRRSRAAHAAGARPVVAGDVRGVFSTRAIQNSGVRSNVTGPRGRELCGDADRAVVRRRSPDSSVNVFSYENAQFLIDLGYLAVLYAIWSFSRYESSATRAGDSRPGTSIRVFEGGSVMRLQCGRSLLASLLLALFLAALPSAALAQGFNGVITGVVKDASGAVVPDTALTIRNLADRSTGGDDGVGAGRRVRVPQPRAGQVHRSRR